MIREEMGRQFLTEFELMVLLATLRAGDEAYGVVIGREIEETGQRNVLLGHVYAALERLEQKGLVSSSMGDPTAARGGRAKRYFKVTAKGIRTLKETQRTLTALWAGVRELKGRPA
jgi:DNA-binding PadR family transcriptional regulator